MAANAAVKVDQSRKRRLERAESISVLAGHSVVAAMVRLLHPPGIADPAELDMMNVR
jgi:hypothetical protein